MATIHPQPRLYSESLLRNAERARLGGLSSIGPREVAELGEAVQWLIADLDAERNRHQETKLQREVAMDLVLEADKQLSLMRGRDRQSAEMLSAAHRDLFATIERERQLEARLLVSERNLDEALARERLLERAGLVQAGINAATIAIAGRPYAEVNAELSTEVAARPAAEVPGACENFDEPGDDRTADRTKP